MFPEFFESAQDARLSVRAGGGEFVVPEVESGAVDKCQDALTIGGTKEAFLFGVKKIHGHAGGDSLAVADGKS